MSDKKYKKQEESITDGISSYINSAKNQAVEVFKVREKKIKYSPKIKQHREVNIITGDEEPVRAFLISKLANELGYKEENIETEKEYKAGRPKTIRPRIDVILNDKEGNPFFFIEVKAPDKFESDKSMIEDQLFGLAALEEGGYGTKIKYLVYYTIDKREDGSIFDKAIIIDYKKYPTYEAWEDAGVPSVADELPARYEKPQKEPFKKGVKDLETTLMPQELEGIRKNLHNVLWGGGSIDDNEIFASLVNIILAKIQDEDERGEGEVYDFQVFTYGKKNEELEDPEDFYDRINDLYRRALKMKLNIEEKKVEKANVINEEKFPIKKLFYVVQALERYSFKEARNNFNGKDILGEFFEAIIREGFKQTKGQFFTPINIIQFIFYGLKLDDFAIDKLNDTLELPYIMDPSVGSGTFLIESMKNITKEIKYKRKNELKQSANVQEKFEELFTPDHKENKWAKDYLYGVETNFNLGTATKVNMILHGDGSTNIFVKDGLLPFKFYSKETAPNYLNKYKEDELYFDKEVNQKFDVVMSNPPFSVDLDTETKRHLKKEFIFGEKKNSENLFIERWYQLLRPGGRLGVVLPESVFDTTENKYIRLFLYKYFKIKAVVSLPQLTFEPYTSTKTSLLFAQKKTKEEIKKWNSLWNKYSNEYSKLKTRCENYFKVYIEDKDESKFPSIKNESEKQRKENLFRFLKNFIEDGDKKLTVKELVKKYQDEIKEVAKTEREADIFGHVNAWWVFGEVARELNYKIFMAEAENIGYKRTKRGEKPMPNELFRTDNSGEIIIDDGVKKTALDYLREVEWE